MIKVELEFHSVPEAIIALNAIMNLPEVKATPVAATPGAKVAEAKARRGRADKGQKRGEYKPRDTNAAPQDTPLKREEAVAQGDTRGNGTPAVAAPVAAPSTEGSTRATSEAAGKIPAQSIGMAPTIGDKDVDAQKAMEALHGKKGLDACRVLLGQFGVSRIREIPTARRAEFLEEAKKAAA